MTIQYLKNFCLIPLQSLGLRCRYTKTEASGMTVMEVGLITGNEAEVSESSAKQSTLKRVEKKDRKVVLYFDEVSN